MCWKGSNTNYQEIYDFIDENIENEKLKEFESRLENTSIVNFNVYQYRFKQRMTFAKVAEKVGIPTNRVNDLVAEVALAFEIFFDIHG